MEAVLDRIVDRKYAVLLVGETEIERIVPLSQLPDGAKEGMKYRLSFCENDIVAIEGISEQKALTDETSKKLTALRKRKKSQFKGL